MAKRPRATRKPQTWLEAHRIIITRIEALEYMIDKLRESTHHDHVTVERWQSTLNDANKTVGLMDAWRKELERRIAEIAANQTTPTSPYPDRYLKIRPALKTLVEALQNMDDDFLP